MEVITVNDIVKNSRITRIDQAEATMFGDTAESMVENYIERSFDDLRDEYGTVPPPVKHAILMLVDHLYQYRGIMNPTQLYSVPFTIDAMLKPYIRF